MAEPLFSPDFLQKLERLKFASKKVFIGRLRGERRSKRKGASVEFADYRNYVQGDDIRFIDWNIASRLDALFLKLFIEEEDLHLHIVVDASASMSFGQPLKANFARRLAAALGYVGLSNLDRVTVSFFAERLKALLPPSRGKHAVFRLFSFLDEVAFEGPTSLYDSCREYALRSKKRGVLVLISDFFDRGGYEEALKFLVGCDYDTFVIQVLSPEEANPTLQGHLKLVDSEGKDSVEVSVSRHLLQTYLRNLEGFRTNLRDFCLARGIGYIFCTSATPLEELVIQSLRRMGLLK